MLNQITDEIVQQLRDQITDEIVQQLRDEMEKGYEKLITISKTHEFQNMINELYSLPPRERPRYVAEVILNPIERANRGINIPDDVLVLRSAFGDRRPTLFCIKKYLPLHLHKYWQNVNLTWDNIHDIESTPKDERAWRKPLPPGLQAAMIEADLNYT